jgi:hypothetical protein
LKWYNIIGVILIICVVVFIQRKFFPEQIITIHTDTIPYKVDSLVYKDSLVPYKVEVPIIDSIPIPVDSAALVAKYLEIHKEYFTVRYYKDSTNIDSMGYVVTKFKVTKNQASEYSLHYNLEKKKIINTTTIANIKNNLYIGGQTEFKTLMPYILFDNKQKYHYLLGYNINNKQVVVGFGVNINKLKFR